MMIKSSRHHRPSKGGYLALNVLSLVVVALWGSSSSSMLWVSAKTISGDFRLSGLNTEYVLGAFAVSPKVDGYMKVTLTAKDPYKDDRSVRLRMYKDDKWPAYQKTPACVDKIKFAMTEEPVKLERKKGNTYVGELAMQMDNKQEDRPYYYYFVMDDCSLEMYMHDATVPEIHYKLETWNDGNHFSADQKHLEKLHLVTLLVSGIVGIVMALAIIRQLHTQHSVHAAMFLVMAAACCDAGSSFFEILHLSKYSRNGVGIYFLDALSAHLEAICDSLVALLLLTVGAGWTLPSDVIAVQQNASTIQKVLGGLQTPFTAMQTLSPTAILALGILLAHIVLAQWGRMYNDDFDSYHDLEHLPGQCLMALRILLGLCMLICCIQTRLRCPQSLQGFYLKLAFVGILWFASLPVLTWVCGFAVPFHLRHWMIGTWGAALQTSSIILLTWLVTSHSSSYHKLSHLSSAKETLTDSLSGVSSSDTNGSGKAKAIWIGNAKIRCD